MEISTIIWIGVGIAVAILAAFLIKGWIAIYNKFQYWIHRARRKFADIDVIIQQRLDNLYALAQIVKKYDIHEHKVLKDVIEARSRWSKDAPLNEKVQIASQTESNFLKLQAVFEKYPRLKADKLHGSLMKKDSRVERKLRDTRLAYNRVAQQYNQRVNTFPRNIIAWIHRFKELNYLQFASQEEFKPKEIFND